jgi:Flp pilus assembly protein TadD
VLLRAAARREDDADVQFALGLAEERSGAAAVARGRFSRAIELRPGFGEALAARARLGGPR